MVHRFVLLLEHSLYSDNGVTVSQCVLLCRVRHLLVHHHNILGQSYASSQQVIKATKRYKICLTLRLLMSYIYGVPSKARNANVVYIWTYVWQR